MDRHHIFSRGFNNNVSFPSVSSSTTSVFIKQRAYSQITASMSPPRTKNPWVQTPLIESSTLSKAAGWSVLSQTIHHLINHRKLTQKQQNISQTRKPTTLRLVQSTRNRSFDAKCNLRICQSISHTLLLFVRGECRIGCCAQCGKATQTMYGSSASNHQANDDGENPYSRRNLRAPTRCKLARS